MKSFHHFLAVLLAVLLCLSLTACGDSSDDVTGDDWRASGVVAAEGTITHEETIEHLQDKIQTMQSDHHRELLKLEAKHQFELNRKEAAHTEEITRLKNRISWQDRIIGCLSFLLLKTSDIFRKAVHSIIRLARDYYKPRFDVEQVSDIKSAINLFGDDKQSHRAAGDFLYIIAKQKGNLDNREQIKARREVDNVVEGHYDQQQKRGFSIKR